MCNVSVSGEHHTTNFLPYSKVWLVSIYGYEIWQRDSNNDISCIYFVAVIQLQLAKKVSDLCHTSACTDLLFTCTKLVLIFTSCSANLSLGQVGMGLAQANYISDVTMTGTHGNCKHLCCEYVVGKQY